MTITLPPALDRMIRDKVNSGLYANESDLVCEALRREFSREAINDWVRPKAAEGFRQLDAGESVEMTREEFMKRLAARRASAAVTSPAGGRFYPAPSGL